MLRARTEPEPEPDPEPDIPRYIFRTMRKDMQDLDPMPPWRRTADSSGLELSAPSMVTPPPEEFPDVDRGSQPAQFRGVPYTQCKSYLL